MVEQNPTTPPKSNPALPSLSSPMGNILPYYAEHNRDEFQKFAPDQEIHLSYFKTEDIFLAFLKGSDQDSIPQTKLPQTEPWSHKTFLKNANQLSKFIKNKHKQPLLLVFRYTGSRSLSGHVTDTTCRPDFVAVFHKHYRKRSTPWPYIHLAGEHASKGKNRKDQTMQAVSYLHYLLLARPDLYIAQGMLTSDTGVLFLVGIGGSGVHALAVTWKDKNLPKLMHAFIYRLYKPGRFADPSYQVGSVTAADHVTFTIKLATDEGEITCSDFLPIYARNPFGTRTHVFSKPDSQVTVGGKRLTVLKDQLCRLGTRFNEHTILDIIHQSGKVHGVVEAVYKKVIELPVLDKQASAQRAKYRLGMEHYGEPFMAIPNVKAMLETVFDSLEALRYLKVERNVLHRDISKGNIVYLRPRKTPENPPRVFKNEEQPPNDSPVYVKYFLNESDDPHETSAHIIDLNNAEHLTDSSEGLRLERTGTRVFIARAVQQGGPLHFPPVFLPLPTPESPAIYARNYPKRYSQAPPETDGKVKPLLEAFGDIDKSKWRHELDHDVESVFWLMFYWTLSARPVGEPENLVDSGAWALLIGTVANRVLLARGLADEDSTSGNTFHPVFDPLRGLFRNLARIIGLDRHWLDPEGADPRKDQEYIVEAFQRLILQFIIKHKGQRFMDLQVDALPRDIELISGVIIVNSTTSQGANSENVRKRPREVGLGDDRQAKRQALEVDEDEEDEIDMETLPPADPDVDGDELWQEIGPEEAEDGEEIVEDN